MVKKSKNSVQLLAKWSTSHDTSTPRIQEHHTGIPMQVFVQSTMSQNSAEATSPKQKQLSTITAIQHMQHKTMTVNKSPKLPAMGQH